MQNSSIHRVLAFIAWSLLLEPEFRTQAFTVETPLELHLTTDFDGDGRTDIVLVDKASGAFRVAYQPELGKFVWAKPHASGVQSVSAVAAGRLGVGPGLDLAFTSPAANRVAVQGGGPLPLSPGLLSVNPTGIGPAQLVVLELADLGTPQFDDLVVTTVLGPPGAPHAVGRIRNLGAGTFAPLAPGNLNAELARLQPVRLAAGQGLRLAGLFRGGAQDSFTVWNPTNPPAVPVTTASVPGGGDYAFGRFNAGHDRHHFLFFRVGRTDFVSLPVQLTPTNTPTLGTGVTLDFGRRVASLVVLPTQPNQLLVSFNDAQAAHLFTFDGQTQPFERQQLAPPAGELITGAVAAPDGSVLLYSAAPGAGASASFQHYVSTGGQLKLMAQGKLPELIPQAVAANVFLFSGEPFVAAQPVLVKTLNAADWASKPDVSGASVKVLAERLGTSAQGLDQPVVRDLGAKPASVTHALANQYAPPISVASWQPAVGDTVVDFALNPLPGPQNSALNVTLTALTPGAAVNWRTSPDEPWSTAIGVAIVPLYRNATIEYFGRLGGAKSRIHYAAYQFPDAPARQDSDGDGVPDFVELARGLDPRGGPDSDGDGYTDQEELFAGTNPLDVNHPATNAPSAKVEVRAAFTLLASPRPYDGFTPGEVGPKLLQTVQLHQLDGAFLDAEVTGANPGALFNPSARFLDAPAELTQSLLAVATASHFQIESLGSVGAPVGRELLALVPVPELNRPSFEFTPAATPLSTQVAAWIAAAKAAAAAVIPPVVTLRFGPQETLAALLLERKVEQILTSRGEDFPSTNRLSLFSFRPGDVTRRAATPAQLSALSDLGPANSPAWNLVPLLAEVHAALATPAANPLRLLTTDLYRLSSLSNHVAPGWYPLPVEVLRGFLDAGQLQTNYLAGTTLSGAERLAAFNFAAEMLQALRPRPTNTFDLEVTMASFQSGCTTLKQVGAIATKNLFVARGVPFKFPEAFNLLPGSRVRVRAFTDVVEPCAGDDLQVISAELIALPAPTLADTDGDFLPDDWECLFLGGLGDDAFDDFDQDGFSNLQEYFDGTDAKDAQSAPASVVNLAPPALSVVQVGAGQLKITFSFPAQYAGKFDFVLQTAADLGGDFDAETLTPVALGNGQFEINLVGDVPVKFFLLQQLKAGTQAGQFVIRSPTRQ